MSLEIIRKYKIKAKKALGQNFLVNNNIVESIASSIEVFWKNIIEVWPWYWALTEKLLIKNPKSLNLVELDDDMIDILEDRISEWDLNTSWIDFKINKKDILKYEPSIIPPPTPLLNKEGELKGVVYKYSVIANIPYYITSPILRHFLYWVENKPEKMVILMQKEVGDKILWNSKDKSSVLSLFIEKKSNVTRILNVPKEDFVPVPKIDSSVLLFEYDDKYKEVDDDKFMKIIKIGFNSVRKKLIRNFTNAWYEKQMILELFKKLDIDEGCRWEDLWIEKWCEIVKALD